MQPHVISNAAETDSEQQSFQSMNRETNELRKSITENMRITSNHLATNHFPLPPTACKRKEEQQTTTKQAVAPKKPRLVFTDLQRRTLQAIFKETKRPSKEMQITISQQLGLDLSTVGNFFMNARRRSQDKWMDDGSDMSKHSSASNSVSNSPASSPSHHNIGGPSSGRVDRGTSLAEANCPVFCRTMMAGRAN